mgnify:CR=1 FL=1
MRNLDITALRSFVAIAETGGVTRAAGVLNLTQSAVSMQIKRLEESLDLKLLERSGRQVVLSPHGEQLVTYARRIINLNDEIMTRLTDKGFEGKISLGIPHDIVYPVVPKVLQMFRAQFPRVDVKLTASYSRALHEGLERGDSYIAAVADEALSAVYGEMFNATADFSRLNACDVIVICVPTPLSSHREPDLSYVENTAADIARYLTDEKLVVLESTT